MQLVRKTGRPGGGTVSSFGWKGCSIARISGFFLVPTVWRRIGPPVHRRARFLLLSSTSGLLMSRSRTMRQPNPQLPVLVSMHSDRDGLVPSFTVGASRRFPGSVLSSRRSRRGDHSARAEEAAPVPFRPAPGRSCCSAPTRRLRRRCRGCWATSTRLSTWPLANNHDGRPAPVLRQGPNPAPSAALSSRRRAGDHGHSRASTRPTIKAVNQFQYPSTASTSGS